MTPADRDATVDDTERAPSAPSGGAGEGGELLRLIMWLGQLERDAAARADPAAAVDYFQAPRAIGRYRLRGLLGSGAHGAVFRAIDPHLGREVALKVPWTGVLVDVELSRRFIAESRTIAAVEHRGIIKVFDADERDGTCYLALELIDGPSLAQWMKQSGRVPVRIAAQIVRDLAAAAHAAHAARIVHRDLKPANVLLRPSEEGGVFPYQVVLTDFGLARGPRPPSTSALTTSEAIIGSDPYMSPEQAAGRPSDVGAPSDVFSLGVILYELLAGRRPFEGETSDDTRRQIRVDEPPKLRAWRKGVPPDLETIALACLEKSPERRYATAAELADDLDRYLRHEPVRARRPGAVRRCGKFARRKPLVVGMGLLATVSAALLSTLLVANLQQRVEAGKRIAAAEAAAEVAEGIERQYRYVADIRQAAEALRRGGRRETVETLKRCRDDAGQSALCGIEWDFLWSEVNTFDCTWQAHPGGVYCVRFSPRGDLLATAGKDGRVVLRDTTKWKERLAWNDRVGEANCAEFSADGSLLAVGGDDGRVIVHRVADGAVVFDQPVTMRRVFDIVWLGNELRFAAAGDGAVVSIVDPLAGDVLRSRELPYGEGPRGGGSQEILEIIALGYSSAQRRVVAFTLPPSTHLLDASTAAIAASFLAYYDAYGCCVASADREYFLTSGSDRMLRIHNLDDGVEVISHRLEETARTLRFSPAGGVVMIAHRNGAVQTLDFPRLLADHVASVRQFAAHDGHAGTVDCSPDGAILASGGTDGYVRVWQLAQRDAPPELTLSSPAVIVSFSPCGRWMGVATRSSLANDLELHLFASSGEGPLWKCALRKWSDMPPENSAFAFSPDGEELLCVDADGSMQARTTSSGEILRTYSLPPTSPFWRVAYSSQGRSVVAQGEGGKCLVYDRPSGKVTAQAVSSERSSMRPATSAARTVWAGADDQGQLYVGNDPVGGEFERFERIPAPIGSVAISPDGKSLAVGCQDRMIYRIDLESGGPPFRFAGHDAAVSSLAFSPDGRTLISNSVDGTFRAWHVATRTELLRIGSVQERITSIGLHPAGKQLVLGVDRGGECELKFHRLSHRPRTVEE